MTMLAISLITALFLIGLGFLCAKKPQLISGYHKLDEEQKGFIPVLIKNTLIVAGVVILAGGIVSHFLKNDMLFILTSLLPLFAMALYILYKSGGLSKKRTKSFFSFFLILLLVIPAFLFLSSKESVVTVDANGVSISGLYGEDIALKEIKTISLENNLPSIGLRTNGFALGKVRKGYFLVDGLGKVKLFLSNNRGPYLNIFTNDNCHLIINSNDSTQMTKLYNQLKLIK